MPGNDPLALRVPRRLPSAEQILGHAGARAGLGALGIVTVICLLELASVTGLISRQNVPPAFVILRTFFDHLGQTSFWTLVWATVKEWGAGLLIASLLAIPLGMVIGVTPLLWRALRPTIEFLRPVPSVALISPVILLYGNGVKSAIILTAFGALWPLLIQAIYSMRDIDVVVRDTAHVFRLPWSQRVLRVYLPSALPFLATGLRISSIVALIVAVTAGLVISSPGLGNAILFDEAGGATALMYSLILASGLLGISIDLVFGRLEARLLHWHSSRRLNLNLL